MNWREKAKDVLVSKLINSDTSPRQKRFLKLINRDREIDAMIEFAKIVCEKQKRICYESAAIEKEVVRNNIHASRKCSRFTDERTVIYDIDEYSIINAPTVSFD